MLSIVMSDDNNIAIQSPLPWSHSSRTHPQHCCPLLIYRLIVYQSVIDWSIMDRSITDWLSLGLLLIMIMIMGRIYMIWSFIHQPLIYQPWIVIYASVVVGSIVVDRYSFIDHHWLIVSNVSWLKRRRGLRYENDTMGMVWQRNENVRW